MSLRHCSPPSVSARIGFKFSAHEHLHGGVNDRYDAGETDGDHLQAAKYMEDLGVAYLHVATTSSTIMKVKGFVECTHPSVPPLCIKPNTLVDLASEVKDSGVRVPVIATGGITDPDDAERILAGGEADMVALGRTLIADGHWARKGGGLCGGAQLLRCHKRRCARGEDFAGLVPRRPLRCVHPVFRAV